MIKANDLKRKIVAVINQQIDSPINESYVMVERIKENSTYKHQAHVFDAKLNVLYSSEIKHSYTDSIENLYNKIKKHGNI